jgi:transposase
MRATGGWQALPAGGSTGAGRWKDATAGRSLAQRLAADGEPVLDVPAKLAARVRV